MKWWRQESRDGSGGGGDSGGDNDGGGKDDGGSGEGGVSVVTVILFFIKTASCILTILNKIAFY